MSGAPSPHEPGTDAQEETMGPRQSAKIIDLASRNALPLNRPRQRDERLGMYAGLGVVALLIALTVWTLRESQERPGRPAASSPAQSPAWPGSAGISGLPDGHQLKIEMPPPADGVQAAAAALPAPDLSPVLANPTVLPEVSVGPLAEPPARPSVGPTVVYESGPGDSAVGFAFEQGAGGDFGAAVKSDRAAPTKAPPRSGGGKAGPSVDPTRTLGKGTLIPAILETVIDSKVPGGVRAVVSTDVLSPDGKRALVPRSSRLVGQYKTRRTAGQDSAYVVWTQIVRPDGVRLDIPSGAAGASERQFFEKFGTARLVSVIAGQSGSDLRARQGEPVRIMAAKDVELTAGR
jgi:type IV secretion system protein VirB10